MMFGGYGIVAIASRPSPPLGAAVLEPRLDLGVCHLELLGEGGSLTTRQVLLFRKPLLQLVHLQISVFVNLSDET